MDCAIAIGAALIFWLFAAVLAVRSVLHRRLIRAQRSTLAASRQSHAEKDRLLVALRATLEARERWIERLTHQTVREN
jgi:predicted lipid-binding transport protein (Tim44 family)